MRAASAESYHRWLSRTVDIIMRRLDRPCSVEEVVAEAAFPRIHRQRMFRAMIGESIAELVRRLRLERAAWRLRQERFSVTDAALDAGYESTEAFSRAFRRGSGLSPSRYLNAWPPPPFAGPAAHVRYYPGEAACQSASSARE